MYIFLSFLGSSYFYSSKGIKSLRKVSKGKFQLGSVVQRMLSEQAWDLEPSPCMLFMAFKALHGLHSLEQWSFKECVHMSDESLPPTVPTQLSVGAEDVNILVIVISPT